MPPAGHPRVLVRPADLARIRTSLDQGVNLTAWKKIQDLAAKNISGSLPERKLCAYGRYDENILRVIEAKAFMYLISGNEKCGKEALAMMRDNLNTVEFTDFLDVTRPIGYTIYVAALVYDWCYPLTADADRQYLIGNMEKLAATMEIGYPPYRQSDLTSHAGEAQLYRDLLAAGIAVYDEHPRMYRSAAGRLFAAMVPAKNFFYTAGRHHQGDSYGPYRFQWEVFAALLFERMCGQKIYSDDINKVPYGWLYALTPDGEQLRNGDTFSAGKSWNQPLPSFLVHAYIKDPVLNRRDKTAWALTEPVLFLLLDDPSVSVKDLDTLPLTRFFPEPLGGMICRTGWTFGRSANTVVAEMKGAGYQFNNHQHLEAGSFQIYYRGTLAADLGNYGKYGTDYDWSFYKRSIAHNVMLAYDPDENLPAAHRNSPMMADSTFPAGQKNREPWTIC